MTGWQDELERQADTRADAGLTRTRGNDRPGPDVIVERAA